MPRMNLSHLEVSLVFAVVCSIVMGIVSKRTIREQIQYGIYTFGSFLAALFGLGWLMFLGHR